ncbi:rRNA-processing protein EBP2-like [Nicotiana tomentosiformis]|uniref:rRNA-processing protein EBP2-like n=1 Tax=Nicotiana tomentosiformis TaxID=4098 RepID=UPI00388C92E4
MLHPLDDLPPTSEKPLVEKLNIEKGAGDLGKEVDTTAVESVVEGGGSEEHVQKEASNCLSFSWTEDEEHNMGEKEEEAVNSHEEHDAQNIANEEEKIENEGASREENHSEEEKDSESEGEDQEKVSESEGGDKESREEYGNVSEEYEGSMTIENTVISPLEETGEKTRAQELGSLLTPFTRDEEVSSDEDDVPLSEVGKKSRKTLVKATKSTVSTRKGVASPART